MAYDCFLSYSSRDLALAERIHSRLAAAGLNVWFDRIRLEPGFDWHAEIEQACESSRVLLPLLTPNWKSSHWTRYETYGAENVIPLLAEGGCENVSTPPLTRYQSVALAVGPESENAIWENLVARIRACVDQPALRREERVVLMEYSPIEHFVGGEPARRFPANSSEDDRVIRRVIQCLQARLCERQYLTAKMRMLVRTDFKPPTAVYPN